VGRPNAAPGARRNPHASQRAAYRISAFLCVPLFSVCLRSPTHLRASPWMACSYIFFQFKPSYTRKILIFVLRATKGRFKSLPPARLCHGTPPSPLRSLFRVANSVPPLPRVLPMAGSGPRSPESVSSARAVVSGLGLSSASSSGSVSVSPPPSAAPKQEHVPV
jgi:hypothetical protein